MIEIITHPVFLWVVGFLVGSGLLLWVISYFVASYCVYDRTLRRRSKDQWSREVPSSLEPDAVKMYEIGVAWAEEHKDTKKDVHIQRDGLNLYGEYYDFGYQDCVMILSGRMMPRRDDGLWGYKVMRNSGYSYNKHPRKRVYQSQTNAGACFLCRKKDFLNAEISQELWVDQVRYPLGEDQVMYYKMHLRGMKVMTYYDHGIEHLDGGNNMSVEKERTLIYSDFRFKMIFWHRFILKPEKRLAHKILSCFAMAYTLLFAFLVSLIKCRFDIIKIKHAALKDALEFIKSEKYKALPVI